MIKNFHFFLFAILITVQGFSQVEEVNPPDYIKTITFRSRTSSQGQLPIIRLGEAFHLEFDVLTTDEPDFYYTIEHYNYDWTKSNLVKMEYMRGFDNFRIVNYQNSFNAFQLYSHYDLQIPNQQTRALIKSGNYIISIFNEDQELVFTRKFMIFKEQLGVGVSIKRSRDVKYVDSKQSVDIVINSGALILNNPKQTVKTLIIQNNNLKTAITGIKPQYTIGKELIYRYTKETAFWASNEFRFFYTKDVRGANVGVQFIDLKDIYHSYLFADGPRYNQPYTYNPDINGNFQIVALDTDDVDIEADYTNIHFKLRYLNELVYNTEANQYETIIKLKQGFYNYKYVVLDAQGNLDEGRISGDYWQTENDYKVLVYYRDLGARFDQLLGFGQATSVNISN